MPTFSSIQSEEGRDLVSTGVLHGSKHCDILKVMNRNLGFMTMGKCLRHAHQTRQEFGLFVKSSLMRHG